MAAACSRWQHPMQRRGSRGRSRSRQSNSLIAAGPGVPLLVSFGEPAVAASRYRDTFLMGLLGAVLAIGSAIVLAFALTPGIGS